MLLPILTIHWPSPCSLETPYHSGTNFCHQFWPVYAHLHQNLDHAFLSVISETLLIGGQQLVIPPASLRHPSEEHVLDILAVNALAFPSYLARSKSCPHRPSHFPRSLFQGQALPEVRAFGRWKRVRYTARDSRSAPPCLPFSSSVLYVCLLCVSSMFVFFVCM